MPKDVAFTRISKNISMDVKRMRNLLRVIETDPKRYQGFFENPAPHLQEFGIDLEKYGSEGVPPDKLQEEIVMMARQAVEKSLMDRLKPIIDMVAATSYSQSTSSSYEYNFDHSSSSDYKYESHTGTSRGTFSETKSQSATDTDTSFSGFSALRLMELLQGPMINDIAIDKLLSRMEKTLDYAAMKSSVKTIE